MNQKAIVTLAVGKEFLARWRRICEPNWKRYADKFGFDLICLHDPLDFSDRAQKRSVSWQKCLILGQSSVTRYEQVVWIDSDILINAAAPDITAEVPVDKVGAAEEMEFSQAEPVAAKRFLERAFKLWPDAVINQTADEYYTKYGLPAGCHRVINAGVMVLSPRAHRALLEKVYYSYEEKGGREWHMEMRPLSYELVNAGLVHLIDARFNVLWPFLEIMYYPFLLETSSDSSLLRRLGRKCLEKVRRGSVRSIRAVCLNAAFQFSFFLHFGGSHSSQMDLVNQRA